MADEKDKDETHIDNLLKLFGAKDEEQQSKEAVETSLSPKAGTGGGGAHVNEGDPTAITIPPDYSVPGYGALAGSLAGASARLSGIEAPSNPFAKAFNLPEKLPEVPPVKENPVLDKFDQQINELKAKQSAAEAAVDAHLRQVTGDPKIKASAYTPEQVERLLAGGNKDPLGTSGRARIATFNDETQRLADINSLNREQLASLGYDPRHVSRESGPLVTLEGSLIKVPPHVAVTYISPEERLAEQARLLQRQKTIDETKQLLAQHQADMAAYDQAIKNLGTKKEKAVYEQLKAQNLRDRAAAFRTGSAKVGAGFMGGAATGAQLAEIGKHALQGEMPTKEELMSALGGLGMTFGGKKLGAAGAIAQLPYVVKNSANLRQAAGNIAEGMLPWWATGSGLNGNEEAELAKRRGP
jgi:hypothetical protein